MIKLLISSILIISGLVVVITATIGSYRFSYVLNRMQVCATSDTLGATFIIAGLIIYSGFTLISVKLLIMIVFLWIANPVASHFLAKTEIVENEKILDECEVVRHDSI